MADDTVVLSRGTIRSSILQSSGATLAFVEIAVFNTIGVVLDRRLDYTKNPNDTIPFVVPGVINTNGKILNRRSLPHDDGLCAYPPISVFSTEGIPAPKIGLPVLSDIDDTQLIIRGGAFDLDFIGAPRKGLPPHTVQFTNRSQSPINAWVWYFGDGEISTEKDPLHTYIDNGEYDVKLVCGSTVFGFAHIIEYKYILVGVTVIVSPLIGKAPLTVNCRLDETYLN